MKIKRKIQLSTGERVSAILYGQKGGDLEDADIFYKGKKYNISKLPHKLFPFSSVKQTPFIDLDVAKPTKKMKKRKFKKSYKRRGKTYGSFEIVGPHFQSYNYGMGYFDNPYERKLLAQGLHIEKDFIESKYGLNRPEYQANKYAATHQLAGKIKQLASLGLIEEKEEQKSLKALQEEKPLNFIRILKKRYGKPEKHQKSFGSFLTKKKSKRTST